MSPVARKSLILFGQDEPNVSSNAAVPSATAFTVKVHVVGDDDFGTSSNAL
jgi:hypothetical protein